MFDARQLVALEHDLGKVAGDLVPAVSAAALESGNAMRDTWAANVTAFRT